MAAPTIDDQRDALALLFAAVTGVKSVPEGDPSALQSIALPAVVLVAGDATYQPGIRGTGSFGENRLWNGELYAVEQVGAEVEFSAQAKAESFIPLIIALFQAYDRVESAAEYTISIVPQGDPGYAVLPYGSHNYAGVRFRFTTLVVRWDD